MEDEKSEKKELKSPERKTDKIAETADKAKKTASKPSTNGSGAAPSRDLPSPDKKTKVGQSQGLKWNIIKSYIILAANAAASSSLFVHIVVG